MARSIIVDLDGTLCQSDHVAAYTATCGTVDWEAWAESTAYSPRHEWCSEIVHAFAERGYKIIFLTARSGTERHREITEKWLANHGFGHLQHELIMREEGDRRPDVVIKEEIYREKIMPYYHVEFALDDKGTICNMWRNVGVPALHCADY